MQLQNTPAPEMIQRLIEAAAETRDRAHAPFSRFKVGAALLGRDGRVYGGCNVEISSYGLTCCAERTAVFTAVADGCTDFIAVAVVTGDGRTAPCGACRQVLADFNPDMLVILADEHGSHETVPLSELLPRPFLPGHLG